MGKNKVLNAETDGRCKILKDTYSLEAKGKPCIYMIQNLINNKVYIGRDINFPNRIYEHLVDLRKNKHINKYLQNAFNKYGEKNFEFVLIETYEEKYLPSMEHYWANLLNVHNRDYGYNIAATNPHGNARLTQEHINNATIAREKVFIERGYRVTKEKIKEGALKRSKLFKGVKWTEERKENYRKMGVNTMGNNPKSKKVINIDTLEVYSCIKEVALLIGMNPSTLRSKLNGNSLNTTKFKHLKDYENSK